MSRANDVELIRTSGATSAERRALERDVRRGRFERLRPGVLVHPGALEGLHPGEQHHVLVRASAHRIRDTDVVSHQSACAVLGLPLVAAAPPKVHLSDPTTTHTRVTAWFVRHGSQMRPPAVRIDEDSIPTTTPARTAIDVAATRALFEALPVVDAVLSRRLSDRATLEAEFAALTAARSKAGIAIAMGSALSGSAAESVCRVRFRELGVPEPVQQHVFARAGSETAVVDFWFPDQGVVVEVDGRAKYEDPVMLDGRSTADVHWREKRREDFIRSCPGVRAVIRLSWSDLMQPDRVRAALRRAGVPCG
ncbi:hypothetical protein [Curtobacterium flaccumfaciens]|uniref:hypothetical protein n=1 Tax=Curtobacterium flaccumfaciens TaxID=2035 RepID=UPI001BDE0E41|nr:hypothetical protein [Curtobacterium flaccumfaciens]MBT1596136.1 hypothetical protein [Curtobacterium flaccumfaciens pv. flaccumfaciens]